jgi:hypothetical protein
MKIKEVFKSLFKPVDEPTEPTYVFEFTEQELEDLKESLRVSGLEFCRNRTLYKKLCEAVCDSYDENVLRRYE